MGTNCFREKVYSVPAEIQYTPDARHGRDKTTQYLKAKIVILDYLKICDYVTSQKVQYLCGISQHKAHAVIDKMKSENLLVQQGKGKATCYLLKCD